MSSSSETSPPITASVVEAPPRPVRDLVEHPAARVREIAAIALMVVLADVTLFWGHGYAGIGAFLLMSPLIFLLGLSRPRFCMAGWLACGLLGLVALRLIWYGTPLRVAAGFVALTMVIGALQAGRVNLWAALLPLQSPVAGVAALTSYIQFGGKRLQVVPVGLLLSLGLPALALLAFSTLFVLANPDIATVVARHLREMGDVLHAWLTVVSLPEVFFWLITALLTAGLLRPVVNLPRNAASQRGDGCNNAETTHAKGPSAKFYPAFRNVLVAVIVLFALYLVFEFKTLWFRDFPQGFYYAGYAHQGAFWLTVALALATATLSVIFRGGIFDDPRLPALRRLAWVWSLLNGLLAVAVYNRLLIYIGFNGLTHMRIVGLLGISAVVAGFVLVVWKIARRRDFAWLISRQIGALALTVFLYAMLPVDAIAAGYNVRQIMAGDESAVMQIGVHRLDTEGVLALQPLLDCENGEIRAGVRALLAERYYQLQTLHAQRRRDGWTAHQFANDYTLDRLRALQSDWADYEDTARRQAALQRFHDYAYQWY